MENRFSGRLGLVQRVLPSYRVPFFDALAAACAGGLTLFAGEALPQEGIAQGKPQIAELSPARNLHFANPQSPLYACYQYGIVSWLERENPAALIVEANFRYLSSPAAIGWMKKRGRPVIGWGLGAPLGRGLLSSLRNRFLGRFDALVAYSARGAEQYAACGFPVDRIFSAPNAVAPAPKHPLPQRPDSDSPRPVALFVGRLQARKRIPSLLAACAELPAQLQPRLIIVGDGPELDNLRSLAQSIYPAAEFPGAKRGDELAPYFLAADLFVLPGTGGLAVQEAMTYGLPVIVAQGDGTQDDLVRPGNGWQITPDDEMALTATLREALNDVRRLRTMGAESYRIVAEEINLEKMVGVFVDALEKVKASAG
jgi:glycosyltransferase involved in cell wall biosynthesis